MEESQIQAIRKFNRDYVLILGILNQKQRDLPFSLTEGRIIFEVAAGEAVIANQLAQKLGLDRSYLTKIVNKLVKQQLIAKRSSENDARVNLLSLTKTGKVALAEINRKNDLLTAGLFSQFEQSELTQIIASMQLIGDRLMVEKDEEI